MCARVRQSGKEKQTRRVSRKFLRSIPFYRAYQLNRANKGSTRATKFDTYCHVPDQTNLIRKKFHRDVILYRP
jgi:hypothetical protein